MPTEKADGFIFSFPDSWQVSKYDDWAFYKNQFVKLHDGIKAVDLVAFDEHKTLWLIEVKDFRQHGRKKEMPLFEEIWKKAHDTLAGIFAAKCNAVNEEQAFARVAASASKIRVVLLIEQASPSSRLFSKELHVADILQQLKRKIKAIDPHPRVLNGSSLPQCMPQWKVTCP